jgi:hypothetical protein
MLPAGWLAAAEEKSGSEQSDEEMEEAQQQQQPASTRQPRKAAAVGGKARRQQQRGSSGKAQRQQGSGRKGGPASAEPARRSSRHAERNVSYAEDDMKASLHAMFTAALSSCCAPSIGAMHRVSRIPQLILICSLRFTGREVKRLVQIHAEMLVDHAHAAH